jgi:hypothetical protein
MLRPVLHAVVMTVLLATLVVRADEPARPVPMDGQCPVAADEHWTAQETFVWGRVCIGQTADFNVVPEYGGDLDPKRPEGLPDNRVLTSAFIETILLADKYRHALTRNGVRIVGARFNDVLDLSGAQIDHELWLDRSLLAQGADFREARSTHRILIDRTRAGGPVLMQDIRIDKDLAIHRSELAAVNLGSSRIGGDLNLDESRIAGNLDLGWLQVAGSLDMTNDEFGDAMLGGVQVGEMLVLEGARSSGQLNMFGAEINGHLIMDQGRFTDVIVAGAHVHGQFGLPQTKVAGTFNMAAIRVDGNLVMNGQSEFGRVLLVNAHLLANLAFDSATIHELLDMTNLRLDGVLDMGGGGDFAEVRLIGAHVGGLVALTGSKVHGPLIMGLTRIDGTLLMNDKAEFADVNLANAHLLGNLRIDDAKISGLLDMRSLDLDGGLDMSNKSEFAEIRLGNGHIGGFLDLTEAKVRGVLNMFGLQLAGALYLNNAEFAEISLVDARIGGLLNLRGSKVAGALDLESIEVHGDVFLSGGAEFSGPVTLIFSNIGELELANGTFHSDVDMTGAQIRSDLALGSPPTRWIGTPTLILHNARADAIQDTRDAWPGKLDLTGFAYRSLGGVHADERDRMADRPVKWFKIWLAKGQYSPQPYMQLAAVLRDAGRPDAAADVLYAGKQRERQEVRGPQRVWLTALDWSVGYGYHVERALFWVAGFIVAGVVVLRASGEGRRHGMPFGLAYSFDLLLPIIRLREMHYTIELAGWARYYFYVHKIMGYVLASFLVVGVTGLVK